MRLADATWTDVRDADVDVAFVPVGSTEQHGPHAPLGTDTLDAVAVAEAGAAAYEAARAGTDAGADAAGEVAIETVDPGVLERYFEVVDGGAGSAFVRARAVDMTGEAGEIREATPLFTIRLTAAVPPAAITLTFETILDHDGETIPDEQLRFDAVA